MEIIKQKDTENKMVIVFNQEKITNFNIEVFREYQTDDNEFYNVAGREHYRLLAYLSTFFSYKNIIDIGTHKGSSALALSYNELSGVFTYDIINKIAHFQTPKKIFSERKNIVRRYENLWDNLEEHKDFLLSSPLIFVDIDPHEGKDELIF